MGEAVNWTPKDTRLLIIWAVTTLFFISVGLELRVMLETLR